MTIEKTKPYDCVITFFGSHHAMKAKRVLTKNNIPLNMIPGPRKISPNCGIAIAVYNNDRDDISAYFNSQKVKFEAFHKMVVDWL